MQFQFNLPIVVKATPRRASTPRLVVGTVLHRVDIPEIDEGMAPKTISGYFRGDEDADGNPISVVFRQIDNELFVDVDDRLGDARTLDRHEEDHPIFQAIAPLFWANFEAMRPREIKSAVYPPSVARQIVEGRLDDIRTLDTLDALEVADVDQEGLEKMVRAFARETDKLRIVGGRLFRKERPPVLEIVCQGWGSGIKTSIRAVRRRGDAPLVSYRDTERFNDTAAFFPLDDYRGAIEFARGLGYPLDGFEEVSISSRTARKPHSTMPPRQCTPSRWR